MESSANPAPFMHYWPTFSDMSPEQQRWYFYWRAQYRHGSSLPTDLSYLFVYTYELINLVEVADPMAAAGQLWVLWNKYRGQYPKLDHYLPDWGGRFACRQEKHRHRHALVGARIPGLGASSRFNPKPSI